MPEAVKFEVGTSRRLEVLITTRLMTPLFSDTTPSHQAVSYRRVEGTQDFYLQRSRGLGRHNGFFETSKFDCLGTRYHTTCLILDQREVALCKNHIWHFPILKQNTLS